MDPRDPYLPDAYHDGYDERYDDRFDHGGGGVPYDDQFDNRGGGGGGGREPVVDYYDDRRGPVGDQYHGGHNQYQAARGAYNRDAEDFHDLRQRYDEQY